VTQFVSAQVEQPSCKQPTPDSPDKPLTCKDVGEAELEHRPVVPHHWEGLGHFAEPLPADLLQYGAVDAGDPALGTRVLLVMSTPRLRVSAWRHRPRPICYSTADILVGRTFNDTRVTNARTEAANTAIKHIERTGRGYRNHGHTRPRGSRPTRVRGAS